MRNDIQGYGILTVRNPIDIEKVLLLTGLFKYICVSEFMTVKSGLPSAYPLFEWRHSSEPLSYPSAWLHTGSWLKECTLMWLWFSPFVWILNEWPHNKYLSATHCSTLDGFCSPNKLYVIITFLKRKDTFPVRNQTRTLYLKIFMVQFFSSAIE